MKSYFKAFLNKIFTVVCAILTLKQVNIRLVRKLFSMNLMKPTKAKSSLEIIQGSPLKGKVQFFSILEIILTLR